MNKYFVLVLFFLLELTLFCQEFNFQVNVDAPRLQTTDKAIFENLEGALSDFINNKSWTSRNFREEERIKGNIQLSITTEDGNNFSAELTIQATRPVYKSDYETVIFSHKEKEFKFSYELLQPIQYSANNYIDELSHTLAFYCYTILGIDADSYSPLGGQKYFELAKQLIQANPNGSGHKDWGPTDRRNANRYWINENYLNQKIEPYRLGWYDYHRLGLDQMHENPALGRSLVNDGLKKIATSSENYRNSIALIIFSNTKLEELVEIFKVAPEKERETVSKLIKQIDPAQYAKYKKELE